jgi:hypothetical protein
MTRWVARETKDLRGIGNHAWFAFSLFLFFFISLWLLWLRKKKSAASGAFEEQTASKVHCLAIHARLLQHGKMSNKAVPEQPWKKYVKERRWLLFQPQSETVQSLSHTHTCIMLFRHVVYIFLSSSHFKPLICSKRPRSAKSMECPVLSWYS